MAMDISSPTIGYVEESGPRWVDLGASAE